MTTPDDRSTIIELTDEIKLDKFTWTLPADGELLHNLRITSGIGLTLSRAEFSFDDHLPNLSTRMRVKITEKVGTESFVLFDGFIVSVAELYDPARTTIDAKTITPTTDEYITQALAGNLTAWNFRTFEPYKSTLAALGMGHRNLSQNMENRFFETGLTYADFVDTLYKEYGVLVEGALLYGLYGFRNTVALTAGDINPGRSMTPPNLGNLPDEQARVNIRNPFLVVDINSPLIGTINYKADPNIAPERQWLAKDNNLKAGKKASDYQIAVDGWILERESAEINFTTELRLDISARTKLTFPEGFWRYNFNWTATKVVYDWNARTTQVTANILPDGGTNALG